MGLQVLHPDVARDLLRGHASRAEEMAEEDRRQRAAISSETCPSCGARLVPKMPRSPTAVFCETGVRYERHCPEHGAV